MVPPRQLNAIFADGPKKGIRRTPDLNSQALECPSFTTKRLPMPKLVDIGNLDDGRETLKFSRFVSLPVNKISL